LNDLSTEDVDTTREKTLCARRSREGYSASPSRHQVKEEKVGIATEGWDYVIGSIHDSSNDEIELLKLDLYE
jgi:hypothetical protein